MLQMLIHIQECFELVGKVQSVLKALSICRNAECLEMKLMHICVEISLGILRSCQKCFNTLRKLRDAVKHLECLTSYLRGHVSKLFKRYILQYRYVSSFQSHTYVYIFKYINGFFTCFQIAQEYDLSVRLCMCVWMDALPLVGVTLG